MRDPVRGPTGMLVESGAVVRPMAARNVMAIASGKGGVGKTWFAITLAQALARRNMRTLLFDGDLGLANVDIQLGLMPRHDLATVIGRRMPLTDAAVPFEPGGFDIIAGQSGSSLLASLSAARLLELSTEILHVADRYDRILLDLGAGVEGPVRVLAGAASTCLVVATHEPTALTDAYAFIKLTRREYPSMDFRIVVNMAEQETAGHNTYATLLRACRAFLNFEPPLAGVIRRDMRVAEAIRAQIPLLSRYPQSVAAADVDAIAARLKVNGGR